MYKTVIYYFSGTGNSFVVARDIADKINGKLVFIPSVINRKILKTKADVIGIVFPTYFVFNGGIPLIIERFIGKLEDIKTKYMFAICTYGLVNDFTLDNLNNIIQSKGGRLSAGFAVKMPYNYTSWSGTLEPTPLKKQKKLFQKWQTKLEIIYNTISLKKESEFESKGTVYKIITLILNRLGASEFLKSHYQTKAGYLKPTDIPFGEILPMMDKLFGASKSIQ